MAKKKSMTAERLLQQLEADPDWVAQREGRVVRHADRAKQIAADEAAIILDLRDVGVMVSSVYDFINQQSAPDAALPVLVKHLQIEHLPQVHEGIIRALGVPNARLIAFDALSTPYRNERNPTVRWLIANSLSGMARLEELSELPGIAEYAALFDNTQ